MNPIENTSAGSTSPPAARHRSRRSARSLGVLGVATLACSVLAVGGAAATTTQTSDLSGDLVFAGFGGALGEAERAAYFESFQELHPGVNIIYDDGVDFAKLKAMVETGNATWDVYTGDLYAADPSEFFEEIDCSLVPCDEIMEDTNVSDYVQIYYTYSQLITFDPAEFADGHPTNWAEFWDVETYPGMRALPRQSSSAQTNFVIALLADGVAADELYPLDYERASAKLDQLRDHIVWYETNAQCPQLIFDGEATVGMCLNGRVVAANANGAGLEMEWNQNISGSGAVAIVKGAKNLEASQALVAHMLSADVNADLSNHIAYGPTNTLAFDNVNPEIAPFLLSSHPDVESIGYNWPYAREFGDEMAMKFDEWLLR